MAIGGLKGLTIAEGTKMFSQGDPSDHAFLIEEGQIEIFLELPDGEQSLALLGPGELFGEMGAVDGVARSASARAKSTCTLLSIDGSQIRDALSKSDPFTAALLRKLISRFRIAQKFLVDGLVSDQSDGNSEFAWLSEEKRISDALEAGEIEPFFQPIVDVATRLPVGFESLARWRSPKRGLVQPVDFLPLAERTGLIRRIDLYLARKAFSLWTDLGLAGPFISVNLSAWNFEDDSILESIASCLSDTGFPAEKAKIEVTESMMFADPDRAFSILTEMRALGLHLSLDDFGTGYSSLSMLHKMPFDTVKIDRSFVMDAAVSRRSRDLVRAIVGIARDMRMEVIAEGVEDDECEDVLRAMGCHCAQGYKYGKPMPFAEARKYWDSHRKA